MGRITVGVQQTPGTCTANYPQYPAWYTYDLLGNMITEESGGEFITFTSAYNGAARLTSLTSTESDAPAFPPNLLSAAHYNAFGGIISDTLGDTETESWTYDNRMRLQASNALYNGVSLYSYSLTFAPNSDVLTANDSVNGNWTYSYDQFNRLTGSNKNSGSAVYSYVYDRFGNRWQQNPGFAATFTGNDPGSPQKNNRIDG
jgi:YD repeat-containing protein